MTYRVDLNCDMGESFGLYKLGNDEEMMQYITSANIACGFHAGDPHVMRKTVELAVQHGVKIGAHPAFPDLLGFGRRAMNCTPSEVKDYLIYQMGALKEFARCYGALLHHCKPHGSLYMTAMEDERLARAILEAIAEVKEELVVYALNNSAVAEVGKQMGIPVALEVYADREHTPTGSIVMTRTGSQIADYEQLADRVVKMVKDGTVTANTGEQVSLSVHTVCIHGDTPGAAKLAQTLRERFKTEEIEVAPAQAVLVG